MEPLAPLLEEYFTLKADINDDRTRYNYRLALKNFGQAIGRPATIEDLQNDNLVRMTRLLLNKKLAATTVNERCGRVAALWEFLARRGRTTVWPIRNKVPEPLRTPVCWLKPELQRLFDAVDSLQGDVGPIPRAKWWRALLLVNWDTGERIRALLDLQWSHLANGWLHIPAEIRKGKRKDELHQLAPDTLSALSEIRDPARELIFPWPLHKQYIFNRYEQILKRAGLPHDRKSKFHRIRRSVASHFTAAGGDATILLGHKSRETTAAYLDPRVVKTRQAIDLLFRPDSG